MGNFEYFFADLFDLGGAYSGDEFYHAMLGGHCYSISGIIMLCVVSIAVVLFYYVVDHARMSKWTWWMLYGAVFSTGIAAWVYQFSINRVMDIYTANNQHMWEYISDIEFVLYAITVMCMSFIYYTLLSVIVKRWSVNNRHTPWKSMFPKH